MRSSAARSGLLAATGALAAVACGSPPSGEPDAGSVGPDALACFTGGIPDWAEEAGAVEIGTGRTAYEPIEAEQLLPLHPGLQGGFHFDVRPRIEGLHAGEEDNNRDPENPHTLASAYDEDGERLDVHTCGYTLPYAEDGDGYELGHSRRLMFPRSVGESLDGERVQLVVEVLDYEGRYARGEVWVVAEVQEVSASPPPSER